MRFTNIGKPVKAELNGQVYYGQLLEGTLFTDTGTVNIFGAKITPLPIPYITKQFNPFCETRQPETPFENWQQKEYGNFIEEEESQHDELKQWHLS